MKVEARSYASVYFCLILNVIIFLNCILVFIRVKRGKICKPNDIRRLRLEVKSKPNISLILYKPKKTKLLISSVINSCLSNSLLPYKFKARKKISSSLNSKLYISAHFSNIFFEISMTCAYTGDMFSESI